jgi:hypothetical protein
MKICPVGAELLLGEGQAGEQHMKLIAAVAFFLLGNSPASKFYVPTFRTILLFHTTYELVTECSKTSAKTIQAPGNHLQERIKLSQHGESLNSRPIFALGNLAKAPKNKTKFPCLGVPYGLPDVLL